MQSLWHMADSYVNLLSNYYNTLVIEVYSFVDVEGYLVNLDNTGTGGAYPVQI